MVSETFETSFRWIRGVNIAGWLLAERLVTPYLFALNSCQLKGDWCFHPGQLGALPHDHRQHKYCDLYSCEPHLLDLPMDPSRKDFPWDEKSLLSSFANKALAKQYMSFHWENFITKEDVKFLAEEAGVQYVKVPIPHYAMNDILDDEPWIDGQWMYFVRFVGWARQYGIKVWIDLHTACGTQSSFDRTSGESMPELPECDHWTNSPVKVERSLKAVKDMAQAVMDDNLRDVVTGFGIMNEPAAANCPVDQIKKYSNDALSAVRNIMGYDTAVYMSDSFDASQWNDGWWTDADGHNNTFLDSHYYHVFAERERALSPRQHIAYTCAKLTRETASCCYEDQPKNTKASEGISRIVGEWSAGYDILPRDMLQKSMDAIRDPAIQKPLLMDRTLSEERKDFLKNHVRAQMVAYENAQSGVSSGWFFWNLKMEGGAFAEWDFTRGVKENWIPRIPDNQTSSDSVFGSCESIVAKTNDDMGIIKEFPDPKQVETRLGPDIDDDYVVSHGEGTNSNTHDKGANSNTYGQWTNSNTRGKSFKDYGESRTKAKGLKLKERKKHYWFRFFVFCFFGYSIWKIFLKQGLGFGRRRTHYSGLYNPSVVNI